MYKNYFLNTLSATIVVLSISAFLTSCHSTSKTLAGKGYSQPKLYSIVGGGNIPLATAPSISNMIIDTRAYYGNEARIDYLKYMKEIKPSKADKYEKLLQIEYAKKAAESEPLVKKKINFLKGFYNDFYVMDVNAFTEKYKNKCSDNVQNKLKSLYKSNDKQGYAWTIFGDNTIHETKDVCIEYLERDAFCKEAEIIFGKGRNPYFATDEAWFKVFVGENYLLVKVYGNKDKFCLMRLINPILKIMI